jgi:uncharacterized protein YbjT (DUF2867 family)
MSAFFICGATGTQGGAVTRALLNTAPKPSIHALARDPSSPKAKALEDLGVKLTPGDFNNNEALRAAISGTSAIFMNFMPDFADWGANLRQVNDIIAIAKEAGVKHIVYSSGVGVDDFHNDATVDHDSAVGKVMASKWDIEQAVKGCGLSWTILRPANFYANYINPFATFQLSGLAETGSWTTALRPTDKLPCVDTVTMGTFSAQALLNPTAFHGKIIAYADEVLAIGDIIGKLAERTGRDLKMATYSDEEIEAQKSVNPFIGGQLCMRKMEGWFDMADSDKWLKEWVGNKTSFDEFLRRESEAVEETYLKR